jgi:hypothetical protein
VLRPQVQARLNDVAVVEDDSIATKGGDLGGAPVTVTLTLRDGTSLRQTIEDSPGSPADPLTPDQLRSKWIDSLAIGLPELPLSRAAALFDQGGRLAELSSVPAWLAGLRAAGEAFTTAPMACR